MREGQRGGVAFGVDEPRDSCGTCMEVSSEGRGGPIEKRRGLVDGGMPIIGRRENVLVDRHGGEKKKILGFGVYQFPSLPSVCVPPMPRGAWLGMGTSLDPSPAHVTWDHNTAFAGSRAMAHVCEWPWPVTY